jgi:hypothetical protein
MLCVKKAVFSQLLSIIDWLLAYRLTAFKLLPGIPGRKKGSFYGGVSPSKIGLSAPSWERAQLRSKARSFWSGWNKPRSLCMGRTYTAKRRTLLKNCPQQFERCKYCCGFEPGTCKSARRGAHANDIHLKLSSFSEYRIRHAYQSKSVQTNTALNPKGESNYRSSSLNNSK